MPAMTALLPMVTALAAEETRELPVPPWVVGLLALGILLALLMMTLSFGKGRDHT